MSILNFVKSYPFFYFSHVLYLLQFHPFIKSIFTKYGIIFFIAVVATFKLIYVFTFIFIILRFSGKSKSKLSGCIHWKENCFWNTWVVGDVSWLCLVCFEVQLLEFLNAALYFPESYSVVQNVLWGNCHN